MNTPASITRRTFGKSLLGLFASLNSGAVSSILAPQQSIREAHDFIYSTKVTWQGISDAVGSSDKSKIIVGLLRSFYSDTGPGVTPANLLRNIGRLKALRDNTDSASVKKVLENQDFRAQLMEDETLDFMGFIDDNLELTQTDEFLNAHFDRIGDDLISCLDMKEVDWERKSCRSIIESIVPRIIGLTTDNHGYHITGINNHIPSNSLSHYEQRLLHSLIPGGIYQVFNSYLGGENGVVISGGTIVGVSLRNVQDTSIFHD